MDGLLLSAADHLPPALRFFALGTVGALPPNFAQSCDQLKADRKARRIAKRL